jgi:hypothetical protein
MKRLAMVAMATFALMMSTGVAMAGPCPTPACATDEPVVTNPQAVPQAAPFQTAGPCQGANCALPEPAPFQTAAPCQGWNCALPEPEPVQTA